MSMYQFSVPVFLRHFEILENILKLGVANATERKIDPAIFFNARLAPDMYPLSRQIQIASDGAKGCVARLSGTEIPSFEDTETTFEDLHARIAKTVAFIKSIPEDKINGSEDRSITVKVRGNDMKFTGLEYLQTFVIPNFYFHVTMTYAILRAQGVPLGKPDFLRTGPA